MNQQEFLSGLRKSLCDGGCPEQPPDCHNYCPPAMDQADAVIACPEVQQLYVKVEGDPNAVAVSKRTRFIPLADWLKEGKP